MPRPDVAMTRFRDLEHPGLFALPFISKNQKTSGKVTSNSNKQPTNAGSLLAQIQAEDRLAAAHGLLECTALVGAAVSMAAGTRRSALGCVAVTASAGLMVIDWYIDLKVGR